MKIAEFCLYMILVAGVLALWEIQIEGKNGWAKNLPTWRVKTKILGGRDLTGYHLFMWIFLLLSFHFVFIFIVWDWRTESLVLGFLTGMILSEDFFWFILNPSFGLRRFSKRYIPWHKSWIGPFPTFMWYGLIIFIVLIWLGSPAILK